MDEINTQLYKWLSLSRSDFLKRMEKDQQTRDIAFDSSSVIFYRISFALQFLKFVSAHPCSRTILNIFFN
uniref:Uncharacterized protein n=2 Tax=Meloidogyne TaxID=189290 RepID=A0A6V7WTH4_MELEN|nr:unnamed protein product [Meloidogyne enterolobii]CAD2207505.1 unnamed protein product [Meloidogyne enterolobii]